MSRSMRGAGLVIIAAALAGCSSSHPAGSPEPAEMAGEPGSAVVSALRALSARQREVVVLRYFADLPEAEIASATGMSVAAVRDHAAQAMSSLQAGLGE